MSFALPPDESDGEKLPVASFGIASKPYFRCECEPPCKGTLVGDRMQHDYDCEYWTLPVGVNKTPFDW